MKKTFLLIIAILLFFTKSSQAYVSVNQKVIDNALQYLRSQQQLDGHIDGFDGVSDWAAMAFSANNSDIKTVVNSTGKSLDEYLKSSLPASSSGSTNWSRRILAVTAAGENPYDFGGVNLISKLQTYYNNGQIGNQTADNDDIFGLLALLASRVSTTSAIVTDTTTFILSHQHTDGGFSYTTDAATGSDIDDTAAAIIALNTARKQGIAINSLQLAIENAKTYVLSHQNADGGFAYDPNPATSWDTTSNVSTTSWTTMALTSLDMQSDSRYTNAQAYLLLAQQPDGSFPYQPTHPGGDTFDTSYAIYALEGVSWPLHIYAGTPTITANQAPTLTLTVTPTPTPVIVTTINTPTPTPTSTPTLNPTPTTIPTVVPTIIHIPTVTPEELAYITPDVSSTDSPTPYPTKEVLGIKTEHKKTNPALFFSAFFLTLGILFFVGHILWVKKLTKF